MCSCPKAYLVIEPHKSLSKNSPAFFGSDDDDLCFEVVCGSILWILTCIRHCTLCVSLKTSNIHWVVLVAHRGFKLSCNNKEHC